MNDLVGPAARMPNPALRDLAFLVGDWRTTGTHPMMPGKQLDGRTSFQWHEGGAFLMMRQEVDAEGFPDGMALIGSDDSNHQLTMIYFDERGTSRIMAVEAGERMVRWEHPNPDFAQRLTIRADGDDRLRSEGLMSEHGGPWKSDLSQLFTRS